MSELANVGAALRSQAHACHVMGSPLYGILLDRLARGEDGGAVFELLSTRPANEDLIAAATVLRLMASVHQLALANVAPVLAAHYPSYGGDGDAAEARLAFVETVAKHNDKIRSEPSAGTQSGPLMGS